MSFLKDRLKGLLNKTPKIFWLCILIGLLGACAEKTSEEFMQEARAFIEAGDSQSAVVALKNAVQQAPRDPSPRFQLGKLYLKQKNFESAEKELSRALELGYASKDVIPMLAQALQRTGANVALAELDYAEAELTSAEKLEVGFRQIQSFVQLEQNLKAEELITELLLLDSNTVYRGLIEGYRLVLDREFETALEKAKSMYERAPLNRDVLSFTARMYMITGDPENAANIYEDYIRVAPDDIEAKFALASMLVEQRQTARAEVYIDELRAISENNPLLNQLKSVVRAAAEDYQGAKEFSEMAIAGGRADPSLRLIAGLASYQLAEYEEAVGHLSLIASILPDNHPGLRILAASQLQANMGDDAGEILARVNNLDSNDASLFSRAGYELLQSGDTEAAKKIIEQADKISETAEDLTRLGVLKLSIDDIGGVVDLESAVTKSPESITAKTTLASAYLATGQLDKAIEFAKQWQNDEPNSVDGFLLESEILQRQGDYLGAKRLINNARALNPNNVGVLVSALRVAMREENFDQAIAATNALLEQDAGNMTGLAALYAIKSREDKGAEAIDSIKSVFDADPSNQNLALLFGRVQLSEGQTAEAVETFSTINADRKAPLALWPMKGLALLQNKQDDEARVHYNTWAELYPNQQNAVLGQLLLADNDREYALGARLADEFLERKDNVQVKLMQSYFKVMSGKPGEAKEILAVMDPRYLQLPFVRGVNARIAIAEGRASEGLEDAKASYENNQNTNNLFVLVQAFDASNLAGETVRLLTQHVERFENDIAARMLLAERKIASNPDVAIINYEKILERSPSNFVVLNNIAYLHMEKGNLDIAFGYAEKAYEIEPDNVATADTYAQILFKQGKYEEAVEAYNRVMSEEVKNEEIFLNYIEALLKNGSVVIAQRRLGDLPLTLPESKTRLDALKNEYNL
ncbi:XrtA/PEP-CTERM system TPR-repeat protein PrsT [Glaciecola petra]|uniref:PEP-CTERM system TPR-repeat protein PrsT n=1 Tax=Glaciecola petra TaxID=3075602 RepID=A0ABU2ZP46_9ALTE|nr:XrtA/PEP-CTERM system TPR-repeat protein PrsT [Aestuariibacter sp. P117]MDT0593359.1 PEP-CTERM system TPR-repeat protein PrsT [Aestuariibacter sp. P117]